jgi:hypothetical protein
LIISSVIVLLTRSALILLLVVERLVLRVEDQVVLHLLGRHFLLQEHSRREEGGLLMEVMLKLWLLYQGYSVAVYQRLLGLRLLGRVEQLEQLLRRQTVCNDSTVVQDL